MPSVTDSDRLHALTALIALQGLVEDQSPHVTEADGFTLHSHDLGSKFGFLDGDTPDLVTNALESLRGRYEHIDRTVWAEVLIDLVNAHLLPSLGNPEVQIYCMNSLHNPVRLEEDLPKDFPHGSVTVPWAEVIARVALKVGV